MSEQNEQADGGAASERHDQPETNNRPEWELRPRVWIGSLADFNAGRLNGEWVEAAVEPEELVETARAIVAGSHQPGAEEWAVFDYEDFAGWRVGQSEPLETIAAVANGIREHGPAFGAWAELHDADLGMLASFADAYVGEYGSVEAWAEELFADMGLPESLAQVLPDDIARYVQIDYAGWVRDVEAGGEIFAINKPGGGVWLFNPSA